MANGELIKEIRDLVESKDKTLPQKTVNRLMLAVIAQLYEKIDAMQKAYNDAQEKARQRNERWIFALGVPLVLAVVSFVWGLLTHTIAITLGKPIDTTGIHSAIISLVR
jgi:hypothetical protein